MSRFDRAGGTQAGALLVVALLTIPACARVHPDDMAAELTQIRQEMRERDEALEQRLGEEMRSLEDRVEHRVTMLEGELSELREDFNISVERLESAIRFNAPVHFAFDDATVQEEDQAVLDRFAEVAMAYYEDALITVEGFTDPAGSAEYNLRLGERRAEAVMEYLAQAGIPEDRMRAVSYGESRERQVVPGAQGPGEEGWENRRVAMVIDFGPTARRIVADDEVRHD